MAEDKQKSSDSPKLELTRDILIEMFRAARAPDPEDAEKARLEKERVRLRRKRLIEMAARMDLAKETLQSNCRHMKPNREECSGGQRLSNGYEVRICLRCQKILYFQPSREMTQAAVELQRMLKDGKAEVNKDGTIKILEVPQPR